MEYQDILYEENGGVAWIWHNRPRQRNAESPRLLHELDDAFSQAGGNPQIKVVVLGGKGDHFCAGHDLKEAEANRKEFTVEQRWALESKIYLEYCLKIHDFPKPTIAMVQGACIAGGFMVANMCDIVVAADDAFFADPVVQSLGAAAVEVLIHPYVLGVRKAKEFLFTGGRLTAAEAERCGMVNRVVPRAELEAAVKSMTDKIVTAPVFGIMLTKRSINRALDMSGFRDAIAAHFDTHQLAHVSMDANAVREAGFAGSMATAKAASGAA
jgi:enoyl-CoA hydratase